MQEKKRVCLRVAYDGTAYRGWQVQNNVRTIEGELNKALQEVTGEEIQVIGASRTDAGVHGLCNVAVFDTLSRIPGEKFSYALNQRLPEDIRVRESGEVPCDFHPRRCKSRKTYRENEAGSRIFSGGTGFCQLLQHGEPGGDDCQNDL